MTLDYILELAAELDHAVQGEDASVAFFTAKPLADELERFNVQDFAPNVRAAFVTIRADVRRMCTNIAAMHYKEIWGKDYPMLKQIVANYLPDLQAAAVAAPKPQAARPVQTASRDIFVSYASEDEDISRAVVEYLKAAGYSTWFDKDNLFGGEEWTPAISKAIRASRMVMLLFSSRSIQKRGFVQKELKLALDEASSIPANQVYIMPVRLDDCERPDTIERYHVLDLYEPNGPEKLLASIANGLGKAANNPLPDVRKKLVDSLHEITRVAKSPADILSDVAFTTTLIRNPSIPSLSDEAQALIVEAAQDPSGIVLKTRVMGGTIVQTNGKGFAELGNARSSALWEAAVDELVRNDLLKPEGYKDEVFAVTHEGFRVADLIKTKNRIVPLHGGVYVLPRGGQNEIEP